jgi:hypothetical protein
MIFFVEYGEFHPAAMSASVEASISASITASISVSISASVLPDLFTSGLFLSVKNGVASWVSQACGLTGPAAPANPTGKWQPCF